MIPAIGVAGVFALGCSAIYLWWRARRDPAYWRKVSTNAASGGAFGLAFALAGTRRLWLLGLGLMVQATSGALSLIIRNARGSNSGTTSAKVLGVTLLIGTALVAAFFVIVLVEKKKYSEDDPFRGTPGHQDSK